MLALAGRTSNREGGCHFFSCSDQRVKVILVNIRGGTGRGLMRGLNEMVLRRYSE
jgi:hypothetical protein